MAREAPTARGSKFEKTMHEWGKGSLHSGSKSGPIVPTGSKKGQKRALAIAFSQQRKEDSK